MQLGAALCAATGSCGRDLRTDGDVLFREQPERVEEQGMEATGWGGRSVSCGIEVGVDDRWSQVEPSLEVKSEGPHGPYTDHSFSEFYRVNPGVQNNDLTTQRLIAILPSCFPRFAAVWCKSFVFSFLPIRKVLVLPFAEGVSPPLPVGSLLFSVSYPQASRSYYLFFNYLFFNYLYMCRFSAKELDSMCRFSAKGRAFNV